MEPVTEDPLIPVLFVVLEGLFKAFTTGSVIALLAIAVLLFFSALISGSEVAFFSHDPQELHNLRNHKGSHSEKILHLIDQPKRLLATLLIANNFVNVSIVILGTFVVVESFNLSDYPIFSFVIQVVVLTSLILFFGEISPKIFAAYKPLAFARYMAGPLTFLVRFFYPLSSALLGSTSIISRLEHKKYTEIDKSELSHAIDLTTEGKSSEGSKKISYHG